MKKKIIASLSALVLVLTIFVSSPVQASTVNMTSNTFIDTDGNVYVTQQISELEMIKELLKNDDQTLLNMGLTQEEIDKYKQFVAQSKARSSQIKNGSLTYTVKWYKDSFKYSNGKTYIKTNVSWSWSSKPVAIATDIIAMGTSENFSMKTGAAKGHINYYLKGIKTTANKTVVSKTVYSKQNGTAAYFKIPMLKTREPGPQLLYALGGSMTVEWVKSGNIKFVSIGGNYGHATYSVTPGISIGKNGISISFTPSSAIKTGPEALINASR